MIVQSVIELRVIDQVPDTIIISHFHNLFFSRHFFNRFGAKLSCYRYHSTIYRRVKYYRSKKSATLVSFRQLYPFENERKHDHREYVEGDKRANHEFLHPGFPVIRKIRHQEKGNIHGDEYGEGAPPGIDPMKAGSPREKNLDYRKERRVPDRDRNAVVDAQNLLLGSAGRIFEKMTPATANITESSHPTPMRRRNDVPEGTVHSA